MSIYNIGDKVIITNRRLHHIWGDSLVGLKGIVIKIDNSISTNEEKRIGKGFNKVYIKATNWGKLLKGKSGKEKKVYAWKPNDITIRHESELSTGQ